MTTSVELCIVNPEGIVEDGFYNRAAAAVRLAEYRADGDEEVSVAPRTDYDEHGDYIEES